MITCFVVYGLRDCGFDTDDTCWERVIEYNIKSDALSYISLKLQETKDRIKNGECVFKTFIRFKIIDEYVVM
jgi:hypothetical protein